MIDAKEVSAAHRARYFWGNLPGMNRLVSVPGPGVAAGWHLWAAQPEGEEVTEWASGAPSPARRLAALSCSSVSFPLREKGSRGIENICQRNQWLAVELGDSPRC